MEGWWGLWSKLPTFQKLAELWLAVKVVHPTWKVHRLYGRHHMTSEYVDFHSQTYIVKCSFYSSYLLTLITLFESFLGFPWWFLECPLETLGRFIWLHSFIQKLYAFHHMTWHTAYSPWTRHENPAWSTFLAVAFPPTWRPATPLLHSHNTSSLTWSITHLRRILSSLSLCNCPAINW